MASAISFMRKASSALRTVHKTRPSPAVPCLPKPVKNNFTRDNFMLRLSADLRVAPHRDINVIGIKLAITTGKLSKLVARTSLTNFIGMTDKSLRM
jgi:hypothetical protein